MIDTPHYHIVESTLRYVAWRNNTFGLHVHVGIHGADRAIAVHRALRTVLPELLALSGSSPWLEGRYTYLHSHQDARSSPSSSPAAGSPTGFADWDEYAEFVRFLVHTRSIREHTEIWWSVRPHQAYPTVETRICDGQPDFARSVALAGLQVALTADFARRYDAGEALPDHPARDLEENFWRAIRWGMSGELIDLELRRSMPAAERIERLLDQVAGTARRPGHRAVPGAAARADAGAGADRAAGGRHRPARAVAGGGRPQRAVGGRVAGQRSGGGAMSEQPGRRDPRCPPSPR